MVPSIFYGHNKQQSRTVLLLPSCTWGEERMLPRTLAPRRGGELQRRDCTATSKKSGWGLVLHVPEQWSWKCHPPLTQTRSVPDPVPSTSPLAAFVDCSVQHLLYRMRLVQNGKNGAGSPVHSPTTCSTEKMKSFLFTSKDFCFSTA